MTYAMKPLPCDPTRIKGMSEQLIVSHHENNYGGAVRRLTCGADALAYRPFVSTDAAVADLGELEIEFGRLSRSAPGPGAS